MVDSGDLAVGAAAVGGAYLLSARAGTDGKQRRPGRIPIPTPGGGGGLSPGVAGLLAQGGGLGGGGDLGGLVEGFSGILQGQQEQFGKLLEGQQAGLAKLFEQQQKLLENLDTGGASQELLDRIAALEEQVGDVDTSTPGGGSNGDGGVTPPVGQIPMGTSQAPEARGANPLLEAARGTSEAVSATAEFVGGPGDPASSGSIFGGVRRAGQLTADIPSNIGSALADVGGSSRGSSSFNPSPGSVATAPFTGGLSAATEEAVEGLL